MAANARTAHTRSSGPSALLSAQARQVLADDAVRGEARGAAEPFWWRRCGCEFCRHRRRAGRHLPRGSSTTQTMVPRASGRALWDWFAPRDRPRRCFSTCCCPIARDVPAGPRLNGNALAQAIRLGAVRHTWCLSTAGPWTRAGSCSLIGAARGSIETVVPLIDTRRQAVVRRGLSGLSSEWDGGLGSRA